MSEDNRPSVTECIVHSERMQGMWGDGDTKEIALSVATTEYLRELETLRAKVKKYESRRCAICNDRGHLDDGQAWDMGEWLREEPSECPYCPEKVDALRAENARLRDAATYYAAEARFGPANPQRDELLRVATALAAGWCGNPKAHNPMCGGVDVEQNGHDWVLDAKRLIAAVDDACEQPAGEAKAWVEVEDCAAGWRIPSTDFTVSRATVHHGHLVPAKEE